MATFSKESGNSKEDVEVIVKLPPDDKRNVMKKDENGNPQFVGKYAESIETANWNLNKGDIAEGKGQKDPALRNKYVGKDADGNVKYDHSQFLDAQTIDKIKECAKDKSYTAEDGSTYYPIKADVQKYAKTERDAEGNPKLGKDGKAIKEYGHQIDFSTIEPSDLPRLTEKRLEKQASNTEAIKEHAAEEAAKEAASKSTKLQASAQIAPEEPKAAEKSADKGMGE